MWRAVYIYVTCSLFSASVCNGFIFVIEIKFRGLFRFIWFEVQLGYGTEWKKQQRFFSAYPSTPFVSLTFQKKMSCKKLKCENGYKCKKKKKKKKKKK